MTEEDLYPWKKKYRKNERSTCQSKKPPLNRPPSEEERKRPKRPPTDTSSDGMMGGNPKNFDYYFGAHKKGNKSDSKERRQGQPGSRKSIHPKDKNKQHTDTTQAQIFGVKNIQPLSQPFIANIPSHEGTTEVPQLPEYVSVPDPTKTTSSETKVYEWLRSFASPVSSISNDLPNLNVPTKNPESLFAYNVGYYVTGAVAAGLAALIGAAVHDWRGRRTGESQEGQTLKESKGVERSRRLHTRDWRRK